MASHGLTSSSVRIVPLGGLGEIGLNLTVIECAGRAILIDAGVMFPEERTLGLGVLAPDLAYLEQSHLEILGVVLTHAHEDHVGALPHLLRRFNAPVYGTAVTLAFARRRLDEDGLIGARMNTIEPRRRFELGPFGVEPIRVTHSTPDSVALAISTPAGLIVHSGDFKIDPTPVDGELFDRERFAELGAEGVALLDVGLDQRRASWALGRGELDQAGAARDRVAEPRQVLPLGLFLPSASHSPADRSLSRDGAASRAAGTPDGRERAVRIGARPAPIRARHLYRSGRSGVPGVAQADLPRQRQPGRAALGAGANRRRRASPRARGAGRHGGALLALHPRQRTHDQYAGQSALQARRRGFLRIGRAGACLRPRQPGRTGRTDRVDQAEIFRADPRRVSPSCAATSRSPPLPGWPRAIASCSKTASR